MEDEFSDGIVSDKVIDTEKISGLGLHARKKLFESVFMLVVVHGFGDIFNYKVTEYFARRFPVFSLQGSEKVRNC